MPSKEKTDEDETPIHVITSVINENVEEPE